MKYIVRERKPIPFSWRFERKMKQNASSFERDTVSLRVFQKRKKMNNQKCLRENWKGLKLTHFVQNTRFLRLRQVACKSPRPAARTLRRKLKKKKISKCFSRLEVPLARESRTEPQKSLCTPRDWTFHSWTSRQPKPQKVRKPYFWKIF